MIFKINWYWFTKVSLHFSSIMSWRSVYCFQIATQLNIDWTSSTFMLFFSLEFRCSFLKEEGSGLQVTCSFYTSLLLKDKTLFLYLDCVWKRKGCEMWVDSSEQDHHVESEGPLGVLSWDSHFLVLICPPFLGIWDTIWWLQATCSPAGGILD